MSLVDRFHYDEKKDILFIDFSNLTLNQEEQVEKIKKIMAEMLGDVGHKVFAIVNYDDCNIDNGIKDQYVKMMKENQETYSLGTVRYSNKPFTRTSLRVAAVKENISSNVCSSREEAIDRVEELRSLF